MAKAANFVMIESDKVELVIGKREKRTFSLPKNALLTHKEHSPVLFFRAAASEVEKYHFEMHMNQTDFSTPDAKTRIFTLTASGDQPFAWETYHAVVDHRLMKVGENSLWLAASGLLDGSGKATFSDIFLMYHVDL
jgi:hypothetical protein